MGGGKGGGEMGALAAMFGGGGKGAMGGGPMMMGGDSKKISRTIGWMNKNQKDELVEPISFSDVIGPLSMIGDQEACKLLKELSEKASEIKNPTKWLAAAATRRM